MTRKATKKKGRSPKADPDWRHNLAITQETRKFVHQIQDWLYQHEYVRVTMANAVHVACAEFVKRRTDIQPTERNEIECSPTKPAEPTKSAESESRVDRAEDQKN